MQKLPGRAVLKKTFRNFFTVRGRHGSRVRAILPTLAKSETFTNLLQSYAMTSHIKNCYHARSGAGLRRFSLHFPLKEYGNAPSPRHCWPFSSFSILYPPLLKKCRVYSLRVCHRSGKVIHSLFKMGGRVIFRNVFVTLRITLQIRIRKMSLTRARVDGLKFRKTI